ncbi:MAG: DAK2 domain-containing protein [Chloroflexota bacterium]
MTQENVSYTSSSMAAESKWHSCNGQQLRKLVHAGLVALEENHRKVNDLNVFPVPDGDTGTNMLLTMRSAYRRIQDSQEEHVGRVAQDLSHGALMGARGNSGVILSQVWRGLANGLEDKATFDAADLAMALSEASETAYKGVMRPVEGTILTVIREGAEEAHDALGKHSDLRFLLARVVERCQQALARTPDMLPVLKQAGVVDAGGQGLVYILDGMLRHVHGEMFADAEAMTAMDIPAQAKAAPAEGIENPYDVQFILLGDSLDLMSVRQEIDAMGDSTVVVGDETTIKVHVHVKDPGVPISYGISLGHITDVVVENMQMQMEHIIGTAASAVAPQAEPEMSLAPGQIGVVAVTAGDGLAQIFRSLGAAGIVNGGQSNNPSTEEIYEVVQGIPADDIVILPNNKNIILAAEAAGKLSEKNVAVVPSRTVPQGISALLALDSSCELALAAERMNEAISQVASGEIAVATRSVELDGIAVEEGQIIGVVDGRLRAAGANVEQVLGAVLAEIAMDERELVSIYYGADVTEADAEQLAGAITDLYPDVEVEVLAGGQSIYQYIIGAE